MSKGNRFWFWVRVWYWDKERNTDFFIIFGGFLPFSFHLPCLCSSYPWKRDNKASCKLYYLSLCAKLWSDMQQYCCFMPAAGRAALNAEVGEELGEIAGLDRFCWKFCQALVPVMLLGRGAARLPQAGHFCPCFLLSLSCQGPARSSLHCAGSWSRRCKGGLWLSFSILPSMSLMPWLWCWQLTFSFDYVCFGVFRSLDLMA